MTYIARAWWLAAAALTTAWLISEPALWTALGFIPIRNLVVQFSGVAAIVAMSLAMLLAARPRWPEAWLGGLDKMYRLHKWLGITALSTAMVHWVASNAPKWAVQAGLIERGQRPPRTPPETALAQFLADLRHPAEFVGEWTFYAAALLMVLALVKWFPYRAFFKTHRLLAIAYLALVFHAVVLVKFSYWTTPVGLLLAPLLVAGTWAAILVLLRRVATERQVAGTIAGLQYYEGVRAMEITLDVPRGWKGHKPGQFAFVTLDPNEGPHPYTIASAWDETTHSITFIVKELGDYTRRLHASLRVGQPIRLEGPYGCFTFEDDSSSQIWVGGGIGITPFIARMKQLAATNPGALQHVHLFHPSASYDAAAFSKLEADAKAAGVTLHVSIDARDGLLNSEKIKRAVPEWRSSSVWFCGPAGLAANLKRELAASGFATDTHFHQELFAMR